MAINTATAEISAIPSMDCFAAEPVIGPRLARTRSLLAMTENKASVPVFRQHRQR
jgi:hypothetical protein